jgi:ADP-heptose:LPS heptosyltransferase
MGGGFGLQKISSHRALDKRDQGAARSADGAASHDLRLADAARDAKEYLTAAVLYERALDLTPNDAAIHVQCGHMFKEAGELAQAERHYCRAQQLTPDDADLALQLGHFYKVTGRLQEAELAFKRAADLDPDWPESRKQLAELYQRGWRNHLAHGMERPNPPDSRTAGYLPESSAANAAQEKWAKLIHKGLIPELAPRPPKSLLQAHSEEIQLRALGRREQTSWGLRNTLRGVDAMRGFCISAVPIVELRGLLNGLCFCIASIEGFALKRESKDPRKRKYVFNIWYDFSNFLEGSYDLEFQFIDNQKGVRVRHEHVVIAPPISEDEYPNSDRLVSVSATDAREVEEQINSRPSMIRPARRTRFPIPPRNVLILRVDQLGDMVISIPAVRRLRELLPEAHLVGLLSLANAELAQSLNLFDEIVTIDFPDDEWERRRVMPLDKQDELRRRLESYKFDVAIDLAEFDVSRPLLQLSGAPFRIAFCEGRSDWLSATYESHTSDPISDMDEFPISTKTLGLVESFGALLGNPAQIVRRDDLARDRLALPPYCLSAHDRFAVLHTGARLKFSQWPHYDTLAGIILERTDLKVVMMTDDPLRRSKLPRALTASDRFRLLDQRLPFDDFDGLLSYCTVFVGNDSGPGHLASLRGANVVNVFLARHNWSEWGHENRGYIISRRVPCAGCNIELDPEECGKGFACITNITPEEVFQTVMKFV